MRLLDSFERRIIFPLMRLIALLAVIALLAAAVASVAGYLVWPAGAQEGGAPAVETTTQYKPEPVDDQAAGVAEEPSGLMDRVSEIVVEIKGHAPDVQQVAVAARGYAAGMLDELKEGFAFGALSQLSWIVSVLSIAVGALLMGFFTLVLLFLAIERNTRKEDR